MDRTNALAEKIYRALEKSEGGHGTLSPFGPNRMIRLEGQFDLSECARWLERFQEETPNG